jgi:flavin-dependent dehydrogenase
VVAGGSFAGLVTATSLHGRVALVEKGEIGEGQTSACVTTLDVITKLGLEDSIEEIHREGVVHTRRGVVRFPLPYAFASFDYRSFCRRLLARFDGQLVRAAATGVDGAAVLTDRGRVQGGTLIDATGWRASLARSADPSFPAGALVSYGLEKPALGFPDRGLHLYYEPRVRGDGYGWSFPAADVARAGVLSFVAADGVRDSTAEFLAAEGMDGGHYHGGYLTAALRPALAGDVFMVGDSAGHCLPLSGEGIRPAVFFAQRLAGLLNRRLAGELSQVDVREAYSALQAGFARRYRWLRWGQRLLRGWPDPPVGVYFRLYAREGRLYRWASRIYWELASPIEPAPYLAARSNAAVLSA